MPGTRLIRWQGEDFPPLETGARPRDLDHGAVVREGSVGEGHLGVGAFQEGPRDEHTETEAGALAMGLILRRRRER